jgi:hypothetical protein
MKEKPFLMNFKQEVPCLDIDESLENEKYSEEKQMSVLPSGSLYWNARSKRYPTSCYTASHRLKAGYTRSGKYKPSRYVPGKSDRRGGK